MKNNKTKLQRQFEEQTPSIKGAGSLHYLQTFVTWLHFQIEKRDKELNKIEWIKSIGESMMSESDVTIIVHNPKGKLDNEIKFYPTKMRHYNMAPAKILPLMDEVGVFPQSTGNAASGKGLPWYILDHSNMIVEYPVKRDSVDKFREDCVRLAKYYNDKILLKEDKQ